MPEYGIFQVVFDHEALFICAFDDESIAQRAIVFLNETVQPRPGRAEESEYQIHKESADICITKKYRLEDGDEPEMRAAKFSRPDWLELHHLFDVNDFQHEMSEEGIEFFDSIWPELRLLHDKILDISIPRVHPMRLICDECDFHPGLHCDSRFEAYAHLEECEKCKHHLRNPEE